MKTQSVVATLFLVCTVLFCAPLLAQPVETTNAPVVAPESEPNQDLLRSNLQLQDQLHTALQAIERARQDAELASKKNAELFSERISSVEKNLAQQREHDLESMVAMRQSNRMALLAAAVVAGIGLLCLFFTTFFQVRAMNRMAAVGSLVSTGSPIDSPHLLAGGSDSVPARLTVTDQATTRFLSAIDQLEKRIHELDAVNAAASNAAKAGTLKAPSDWKSPTKPALNGDAANQVRTLLAEGQSVLNRGDADNALLLFEKAVELEPESAEALVKKGTALEAQRKLHEAIESYDRAITLDSTLTVAYLYKGGALNRLQRFSEAMACYEQALRNHTKKAA